MGGDDEHEDGDHPGKEQLLDRGAKLSRIGVGSGRKKSARSSALGNDRFTLRCRTTGRGPKSG